VIGYYVIIACRHDTTSRRSQGIRAPRLPISSSGYETIGAAEAVEEMIRWVSPVKQFMRTATRTTSYAASRSRGESVLLSYPSANRDEDVFERSQGSTSA
jgi:cytochrome P450